MSGCPRCGLPGHLWPEALLSVRLATIRCCSGETPTCKRPSTKLWPSTSRSIIRARIVVHSRDQFCPPIIFPTEHAAIPDFSRRNLIHVGQVLRPRVTAQVDHGSIKACGFGLSRKNGALASRAIASVDMSTLPTNNNDRCRIISYKVHGMRQTSS